MKVKVAAKGFNSISGTVTAQTIETCIRKEDLDYNLGKILYTLELSGFNVVTHEIFMEYKRNASRFNFANITDRYFPLVSAKFNEVKVVISVAKA